MPPAPGYADECIQRPVVEIVRERGFDIVSALEAGQGQQPDRIQLAYATSLNRVLLTYNRWDFRRLHRDLLTAGVGHAGIVLLPQPAPLSRSALRICMLLDWLGTLDASAHHSRLFPWNELQLALHAGDRLPGYTEDEVRDVLGET